jgi:DNA-binding protein HU-beta
VNFYRFFSSFTFLFVDLKIRYLLQIDGRKFPQNREETMTKAELVESVAAQTRMTKKAAAEMMDVVFNTIGEAVKKDARFSYPGFGTWSLRTRKERHIRNPSTNEIMKLKAMTTIGFRPAKELKETL